MEAFWSWPGWPAIAAIATVLYTYFTYRLLSSAQSSIDVANQNKIIANKLAEFQIYMNITDKLSSDKSFELLEFMADVDFSIIEVGGTTTTIFNPSTQILEGDLRRFILNPLEDLAKFHDDGLVSLDAINTGFGSSILLVGSSKQVVNYIRNQRSKEQLDDKLYVGIESLFEKVLSLLKEEERQRYPNYFKS